MSELSLERLRELARLARLALDDDTLVAMRRDLEAVLGYAAVLDELDLDAVEPTRLPAVPLSALRDDTVEPADVLPRERFLALAPATDGASLRVPRVLGGES